MQCPLFFCLLKISAWSTTCAKFKEKEAETSMPWIRNGFKGAFSAIVIVVVTKYRWTLCRRRCGKGCRFRRQYTTAKNWKKQDKSSQFGINARGGTATTSRSLLSVLTRVWLCIGSRQLMRCFCRLKNILLGKYLLWLLQSWRVGNWRYAHPVFHC